MTTPATVKRVRARGHITQAGLARLLCVTPQTVSNWESGRAKPDIGSGAILLRMLRLSRRGDLSSHLDKLTNARDVRTGDYVRLYDTMHLLFRTSEA